MQGSSFNYSFKVNNLGASVSQTTKAGIYLGLTDVGATFYSDTDIDPNKLTTYGYDRENLSLSTSNLTPGRYTLVIKADDAYQIGEGSNENNAIERNFIVKAAPHINQAPVVGAGIPAQSTTEGEWYSYKIPSNAFSDPEGDTLTYKVNSKPDWLNFDDGSNTFSGTAPQNSPDGSISITASDPSGLSASTTFSISTITPAPVNTPHTGTITIDDTTPKVNQTLTAVSSLNDADGLGALSYQWLVNDAPVGSNSNTYSVTQADAGKAIKVTASFTDGKGFLEVANSDATSAVSQATVATYNGNQYFLSHAGTWTEAEAEAVSKGGHLVTINDQAEQDWLVSTFSDVPNLLIGYTDQEVEGTWKWISGENSTYTHWNGGEPNNAGGSENYANLMTAFSGLWNDIPLNYNGVDIKFNGVIEIANHAPTGTVSINETSPKQNQMLTATANVTDADGLGSGGMTYQWFADNVAVDTGVNHIVSSNEIGKAIKVIASYTDGWGKTEFVNSNKTNSVIASNLTVNGKDNVDDVLSGGVGNDTINGYSGADTMTGGTGNDTYYVDNRYDSVIETSTLSTEIDTVHSYINYVLANNVENLMLEELSTATIGTGNDLNNTLIGNSAANTLDGKRGADIMDGDDGDDIYIVDNLLDIVTEQRSDNQAGTDTIRSYVTYTLGDNIENLTLIGSGTAKINATGNSLNNVLTGNSAANNLIGNAGADKLIGGVGNDILNGGTGKDNLTGSGGADTFKFSKISDSGISTTTRDTITDFKTSELDKIDLSAIDADSVATGNNAFSVLTVGNAFQNVFTNRAELYFDTATHILYGNNDTDKTADFSISLSGVTALTKTDFIL